MKCVLIEPSRLRLGRRSNLVLCSRLGASSLSLVLLTSCEEPLKPKECERLLDHYTERLVRDETPKATAQLISAKQAAARKLAKNEPAFEWGQCEAAVSRTQFECAMSAVNVDGIEQCLTL